MTTTGTAWLVSAAMLLGACGGCFPDGGTRTFVVTDAQIAQITAGVMPTSDGCAYVCDLLWSNGNTGADGGSRQDSTHYFSCGLEGHDLTCHAIGICYGG